MSSFEFTSKQAARLSQMNIEDKRISAHSVVVMMLRDKYSRKDAINSARQQIAKWKINQLCSPDYIQEWEILLRSPLKTANILESMDPISIRLRQNSPFSAFLR